MFIDVLLEHGVPLQVYGDSGGESHNVSILMILLCGLNKASFLWGSSVFNTQIEHLWVEVGKQFVWQWQASFLHLEQCYLLQCDNQHHQWLLHYLFLKSINDDCRSFTNELNSHPLLGVAGRYSPSVSHE